MRILFALLISTAAFACPVLDGKYVREENQNGTYIFTQTACDSVKIESVFPDKSVEEVFKTDGHFRKTDFTDIYLSSAFTADSLLFRTVTGSGGLFGSQESFYTPSEEGILIVSNFYDSDGNLTGSITEKLLFVK